MLNSIDYEFENYLAFFNIKSCLTGVCGHHLGQIFGLLFHCLQCFSDAFLKFSSTKI